MAEALTSLLLERICLVFPRQVLTEVNLVRGVKKQTNKLKNNLSDIKYFLEDAERRQEKENGVRVWLDKLKDVCYDMDDVLDEWSIVILTWEMDEENAFSLKKMRSAFMRSPCFCLNQVVRCCNIAHKIKAVSEKLDEIAKEKAMYSSEKDFHHELPRPTSTSFVDESSVWGRDDEKIIVIRELLAESSQEACGVPIISLGGLSGIGKTTLAQLVFNDDDVTAHFKSLIWVCFSKPFDGVRIAKSILQQLEVNTLNLDDLQSLLKKISQSINGIRVLVLDDVWSEDYRYWEQLMPSLAKCARGSKIIVTTRNDEVAKMMRTSHHIDIETLSHQACMSIFNHETFYKISKDERLKDIADEIVKKCKGLPLAAKVLGRLMQSKNTPEEWNDVLLSELWKLNEIDKHHVEEDLFLSLRLSYYDLPPVVRQCFLYCAIFPKDYEMNKFELVNMWMAQGYLEHGVNKDMKVVGEQYCQVLKARSFFQDIKRYGQDDLGFKMHGIVHDFAHYMTKNECLIVDDNNLREALETSTARVRHLNIMVSEETSFLSSIYKVKGLRSLLIGNTRDPWLGAALPGLFKQLTCIRSLNLSGSSIKEIPKEVGRLIHLRHLNLEDCVQLISLPESMCDLFNLQSLNVNMCLALNELPLAIVKLVKLRHLCIYDSGVAFMPKGIERLTCLRMLDCFMVCGGGENESKAANLRELKNLNDIGGSLVIWNLRGDIKDAEEAQLQKKKRLLCLELHFCVNHEDIILIDVLQPPSDLVRLSINEYGGIGLPNWIMTLTRLQELELIACENLEVLPPLGRLLNLENHKVEQGDGIERRVGEEDATTTSIFIMPQLQKLRIFDCPLLRALPDYVLSAPLQVLEITHCPNLSKRYGEEKGEDRHKISHIPKITIY